MIDDICSEQLYLLGERFGISLPAAEWESKRIFGGIAMDEVTLTSLQRSASLYRDTTVTLYEMETIDKSMQPSNIPLSCEGLRVLRGSLMAHFNLVWVPPSRKWALVTNVEMETYICGTQAFVESMHGPDNDAPT